MKLEVGKCYLTRDGDVASVSEIDEGLDIAQIKNLNTGDIYWVYSATGRRQNLSTHGTDLISECKVETELTIKSDQIKVSEPQTSEMFTTKRELVAGDYGRLNIFNGSKGKGISLNGNCYFTADELRDLAEKFNAIADFMEHG